MVVFQWITGYIVVYPRTTGYLVVFSPDNKSYHGNWLYSSLFRLGLECHKLIG